MTTTTDILQLIAALSVFAVAIALVPALLQMRRTLKKTETFVDTLNKHADPLCKSLTDAANELQVLSLSLTDKVEKTDAVIETAKHSADTVLMASQMLRDTVRPFISTVGGLGAGFKTFSFLLGKSFSKKSKGGL